MFRASQSSIKASKTADDVAGISFVAAFLRLLRGFLRERWILICAAPSIARERRQLLKMTDSELSDMGITRAQAEQESKRAYFDIPHSRLALRGLLDTAARKSGKT